jgi:hypothetical protein
MNRGLILSGVLIAPMLTGCAESSHDGLDELAFRGAPGDAFWVADPGDPGDGDIEVRKGGDVDGPDTILWDINGGNVTEQLQLGVFATRWVVVDDEIWVASPANGTLAAGPTCTAIQGEHASGKEFALVDAEGQVVLTLWERFVVVGDADVPIGGNMGVADQVSFSFKHDGIYLGKWPEGEPLARADQPIDKANPMRRLLLGALVAGECGSDGVP